MGRALSSGCSGPKSLGWERAVPRSTIGSHVTLPSQRLGLQAGGK